MKVSAQPQLPSAVTRFRYDHDFIECPILNEIWQYASTPAARVVVVG